MLEESFNRVYNKFKMVFYRKVFDEGHARDASLSAMECFALEIIYMLDRPTISRFADFLDISQSNATYKINNLIKKGYLERQNSNLDRREFHLVLTEKCHEHLSMMQQYQHRVIGRMKEAVSAEDLRTFERVLNTMEIELMPEGNK